MTPLFSRLRKDTAGRRVTLFALLSLLPPMFGLAAQDASTLDASEGVRIIGSVIARGTGEAVPAASIALTRSGSDGSPAWSGQSDQDGTFRTEVLPLGGYVLQIDVLSYSSLSHLLILAEEGVVDVRVELVQVDFELEPIVAVARRRSRLEVAGFYEREREGRGYFFSRDDIEDRSPLRISDLFRTIPGARVVPGRSGRGDAVLLRGGCTPVVVLDGVQLSNPVRLDELFPTSSLDGIEVYHGSAAPIQYTGRTTCGVIMLWSRTSEPGEGKALTWRRALAVIGIGAPIILGAG